MEEEENPLVNGIAPQKLNSPADLVCERCRCYKCIELFVVNDKTICANCSGELVLLTSTSTYSGWQRLAQLGRVAGEDDEFCLEGDTSS